MRAIDADELKKYARVVFDNLLGRLIVVDVSDIDKAPTVELFSSYLSDGEVRQPCIESPCKHERPQGEWIRTGSLGNGNAHYECSECHYGDEHAESQEVPYCWHCGARMMKGGGEND